MSDQIVFVKTCREGYSTDQIGYTMTVGDMIDFLRRFDKDAKIYLDNDNGYTYGGVKDYNIEEARSFTCPKCGNKFVIYEGDYDCYYCGADLSELVDWDYY